MAGHQRYIHRTLNVSASDYEQRLSRTLIGILGRGIHDLPGIVAALSKTEVGPQSGGAWTEETFVAEMERLGAYPNSVGAPLGAHALGVIPPGASTDERPKLPSQGGRPHAG